MFNCSISHIFSIRKKIPYSETTYLFPERELSLSKLPYFISMIVENDKIKDEVKIITTNQNIIIDMVDCCVRVLNEKGEIVASPIKTLAANIHDIRYKLLENPDHCFSKKEKERSQVLINEIMSEINSNNRIEKKDYERLFSKIQLIGEPLIQNAVESQLNFAISQQHNQIKK